TIESRDFITIEEIMNTEIKTCFCQYCCQHPHKIDSKDFFQRPGEYLIILIIDKKTKQYTINGYASLINLYSNSILVVNLQFTENKMNIENQIKNFADKCKLFDLDEYFSNCISI